MEKIDFKDKDIDTEELLVLVANKVQEVVEWINEHEIRLWSELRRRSKPGGSMTQNENANI